MDIKKVIVFGGGLVGSLIARTMAADPRCVVTLVDKDPAVLSSVSGRCPDNLATLEFSDLRNIGPVIADFDLVIAALPSTLGLGHIVVEQVVAAGKDFVDITFMEDVPTDLDAAAKAAGVSVIWDMGVAPGTSNIMIRKGENELDDCEESVIYVGGLPHNPQPPFYYTASWCPMDVFYEYTRMAAIKRDGEKRIVPSMTEREFITLPHLPTTCGFDKLEAFISDGSRSLIDTSKARAMTEKTLRFPGHLDAIKVLVDAGLLSEEKLKLRDGNEIVPLHQTANIMWDLWTMDEGDTEFTIMRVQCKGTKDGKPTTVFFDYFVDHADGELSMSRATGFACCAAAKIMLFNRGLVRPGIVDPEELGEPGLYEKFEKYMGELGLGFKMDVVQE